MKALNNQKEDLETTKMMLGLILISCYFGFVESLTDKERFRRIVGGIPAEPGQIPYQAFIKANGYICGGVIISENWVVTAAHCYKKNMWVSVGRIDISGINTSQMYKVVESHMHEQYNISVFGHNDILLLKVKEKLKKTSNVDTIELANGNEELTNQQCYVSGFGREGYDGAPSQKLLVAGVKVWSDNACLKEAERDAEINFDSSILLCAGDNTNAGPAGSCRGDSGGPLTCGGKLVGIVSCGRKNPPAFYVRVSAFRQWIKEKTGLSLNSLNQNAVVETGNYASIISTGPRIILLLFAVNYMIEWLQIFI